MGAEGGGAGEERGGRGRGRKWGRKWRIVVEKEGGCRQPALPRLLCLPLPLPALLLLSPLSGTMSSLLWPRYLIFFSCSSDPPRHNKQRLITKKNEM